MEGVKIIVDTGIISRQAGLLKYYCNEVAMDFSKIQKAIAETSECWKGDAGYAHRRKIADMTEEIDRVLREINSYPDKLGIIAVTYEEEDQEEVNTLESTIKIE